MASPKADRPWENESPMNAAIPERRPASEEICGLIERVTFHNDESGFCVLRVKARGQRDETTVVGSLPSVTAGEWLSAEGWWVRDKEHGLQFKATIMKTVPPTTAEGIERYLASGLVKGIGPILAKKLVGRFGAEVLAARWNRRFVRSPERKYSRAPPPTAPRRFP
jgi:exodeoxyribonuclease V alpha subunit